MIIDSKIGGMGDVWMRLVALYTLSNFDRGRHTIIVNPALVPLGQFLFGDRISVVADGDPDVTYTHYGLRHLAAKMLKGEKYVYPFHWILKGTRKQNSAKDLINDLAVGIASKSGRLLLPRREYAWEYQGFMEITALRPFAEISQISFQDAAVQDWNTLSQRIRDSIVCKQTPSENGVVFPSGTAHQIMPVSFAKQQLASSIFAFHFRDPYARDFSAAGLKVATFSTPEEMLRLGCDARFVVCTDSFPSHLWQTWGSRVFIALSQQTTKQVVHPGFPAAQIIDSRASCVRCRSRVRTHAEHVCDAGKLFCVTWDDPQYVHKLCQLAS